MQTDSHVFSKEHALIGTPKTETSFSGLYAPVAFANSVGLEAPSVSVQNEANLSSLNPPVVFAWGRHPLDEGSGTQNPFQCLIQPVPLGFSSAAPFCNTILSRTSMQRNAASFIIYLLKFSS